MIFQVLKCLTVGIEENNTDIFFLNIQATLAELGREYQGLLGSNAGLVADKNDLRAEVHRLQALLQDKEKELSESKERCDEMMRVSGNS